MTGSPFIVIYVRKIVANVGKRFLYAKATKMLTKVMQAHFP